MPEPSPRRLQSPDIVGVEGARPYGIGGVTPADAVVTATRPNGNGGAIPYVSDAPFIPPTYAERMQCDGTRTNGQRCKAKAEPGSPMCGSHRSQG